MSAFFWNLICDPKSILAASHSFPLIMPHLQDMKGQFHDNYEMKKWYTILECDALKIEWYWVAS